MRRLLVALGLIGLVSPVLAADYDLPTLRGGSDLFVPAFPVYPHWDGFYFGGQLSFGNLQADFTNATQPLFAIPLRDTVFEAEVQPDTIQLLGAVERSSGGVGGFVGYNWQFDEAIVGFEFNYIHTNMDAGAPSFPLSRQTAPLSNGLIYQFTLNGSGALRLTDVGELRARFGYALGAFMPYLTMGLASGRADVVAEVSCLCTQINTTGRQPPPPLVDFSFTNGTIKNDAYMWGYSGGGGLEWALTQNLFARADYEYIQWTRISLITAHLNIAHLGFGVKF